MVQYRNIKKEDLWNKYYTSAQKQPIYKDNRLDRIIRLPKSSKRCFQVATMADGKVTYTTQAVDNKLCK